MKVGVVCGACGGGIHFVTCDEMRGTGHEWVLWGRCLSCGVEHATESGCLDCREAML